NELETLSLKFRRSMSARAVLSGVVFQSCPRCAQVLPARDTGCCHVCGQTEDGDLLTEPKLRWLIATSRRAPLSFATFSPSMTLHFRGCSANERLWLLERPA